jgi:quercetin dioxygenase-like cupin family protein
MNKFVVDCWALREKKKNMSIKARRSERSKQRVGKGTSVGFAILFGGLTLAAQERGVVKPQLLFNEIVAGMPKGEKQEVRVLTANFRPGERTLFHTHRFPVTLYILEGAFRLELEGREPITVNAGEAKMMPANVKMTGYNKSSTEPLRLVVFYVSDPGTPFLDPIH